MADDSVHCVVTSPPYWGLRDYGLPAVVWGGDPACAHEWGDVGPVMGKVNHGLQGSTLTGGHASWGNREGAPSGQFCARCDAWRGALGLEPTPDLYVQHMVDVFREVRRVLREDGTCWLNMGDCYAGNGTWMSTEERNATRSTRLTGGMLPAKGTPPTPEGLKPKDLIGMPWRVAFALQADGWYLRSDIIWSKPNPMPESVTDRPTKAHEYVFLLAKSARYVYDAEAIREPLSEITGGWQLRRAAGIPGVHGDGTAAKLYGHGTGGLQWENDGGRNKRTVWEIATQPYPEAHFATFPEALVEPCILAGTSERGCCPSCGAPWEREIEREPALDRSPAPNSVKAAQVYSDAYRRGPGTTMSNSPTKRVSAAGTTTGWHPTCGHDQEPVPATVLDPFAGSGTALLVGKRHGRSVIGIELSEEYCTLITHRLAEVVPDG
jgi:DNA modification methylase